MATHSSILAWEIPWTEEPGGLPSIRVTESRTQLSLSVQGLLPRLLLLLLLLCLVLNSKDKLEALICSQAPPHPIHSASVVGA